MEIRRFSLCLAFLLVAVVSHCSAVVPENGAESISAVNEGFDGELRYEFHDEGISYGLVRLRRDTRDKDYFQDDEATDTEQNDADGGDEDDDAELNANIVSVPENFTVQEGQTVRLECKIDIPDSVVGWKKDDLAVIVNGFVVIHQEKYIKDGTDLIVKNLTQEDSGAYVCEVVQVRPVSITHRLVVFQSPEPKVQSITASDGGHPQVGSDLTLTCHATGHPAPTIVWSKVVNNENTRVAEGASFTIKDVKLEHSGKYLCYAITGKAADTKEIRIVVKGTPRMHVPRTVINSVIGVEAVLQCSVHEEEPVTITWFKGDQQIAPSRYTTRGTHSNLTVTPLSDSDFGRYTCKAECEVGKHHRSIELVQTPVVEELESDGQKLSWRVHSYQPLKSIQIQLLDTREGAPTIINVPVPETKTHEYEMSYVVDSSVKPGEYQVVVKVENSKGMSESDAQQIHYEHVEQEELIRTAPVVLPGGAHVSRPTTALLSTVLMYLLVRML